MTGVVFTQPFVWEFFAFNYFKLMVTLGEIDANLVSIVRRIIVQHNYLIIFIILVINGLQQVQDVILLVAGGDEDRDLVWIQPFYMRQFWIGNKVEHRYRKAQDNEEKRYGYGGYHCSASISVCSCFFSS